MRKVVKISGKEYSMKSSAYTQFKYKDVTGRKMLDDIQKISNINKMNEESQELPNWTDVISNINTKSKKINNEENVTQTYILKNEQ